MRFGLYPNVDFVSAYSALVSLEEDYPKLTVATTVTSGSSFILTSKNTDTARYLSSTSTLRPHKTVAIQYLDPAEVTKKCILMGFPLEFSLKMLEHLPNIVSAKRCYYRFLKTETWQVLLTIKGDIPSEIDVGNFGIFKTRSYTPEPLRCFKCQRFGHHKGKYKAPLPRCAICASNHETSTCLTKLKEGNHIETKCLTCNLKHHAWDLKCPQRVARLQKTTGNNASSVPNATSPKQALPPISSTKDWPALPGFSSYTQSSVGPSTQYPAPSSTQNKSLPKAPNPPVEVVSDVSSSHFNTMMEGMETMTDTLCCIQQVNGLIGHLKDLVDKFITLPSAGAKTPQEKNLCQVNHTLSPHCQNEDSSTSGLTHCSLQTKKPHLPFCPLSEALNTEDVSPNHSHSQFKNMQKHFRENCESFKQQSESFSKIMNNGLLQLESLRESNSEFFSIDKNHAINYMPPWLPT